MGKASFFAFLAVLAFYACAPMAVRADTLSHIRQQITAANNRFGPAVMRHDAGAIASDYLPDGVLVPRKGPPIRGRDAIKRYYAQRVGAMSRFTAIVCATRRIAFDGTAVLEEGSCTLTPPKNSKARPTSGSFLTIWKKDSDGRWRIAVNE